MQGCINLVVSYKFISVKSVLFYYAIRILDQKMSICPYLNTGRAWCPAHAAKNEWLLVDLGVASTINGVVTEGRGNVKEWITHFMISYSLDAYKWEFARDIYGNKKVSFGLHTGLSSKKINVNQVVKKKNTLVFI